MGKKEFTLMLAELFKEFYIKYRNIGVDYGFRLFYQYILDEAKKYED